MPVLYNATQRFNPRDRDGAKKWYLILKRISTKRTREIARRMADETTMNPKEAEIGIYQLVKVMKQMLANGHTVQLDDLGTFYLTASSAPSDTRQEVTVRNCLGLKGTVPPRSRISGGNRQGTIKISQHFKLINHHAQNIK